MGKNRNRSNEKRRGAGQGKGTEVFGLAVIGTGFLLFFSLAGRLVQGPGNLLGPYLGVWLSATVATITGPLPAFLLPLILFSSGWKLFRGEKAPYSMRNIVFFILLFIEFCALLSINIVRVVPAPGMLLGGGGIVGSWIARLVFVPIFGNRAFGPYFVTLFGIFVTVVWGARLRLMHFRELFEWLQSLFEDVREGVADRWEDEPPRKASRHWGDHWHESPASRDEMIREEETQRQESERRRLEEKQQEFIREKSGLAPQIMDGTQSENPDDSREEEESSAEKRQRKQAALSMPGPKEGETDEDNAEEASALAEPTTKSIPVIAGVEAQREEEISYEPYQHPPLDLLQEPPPISEVISKEELVENSKILEDKLNDFDVQAKVTLVHPGPIITRYELELAPGIKVSKVQNLSDDLAMAMKALRVRILAPIPGKAAVGIELPNSKPQTIFLREVLASDKFPGKAGSITIALGKTITGESYVADLTRMPHLLVAGQTGSGKSVCVNCIISSVLYSKAPEDCRLLLIDPKVVELALYNNIPHLFAPVVTDSREAVKCLKWAVAEMERRYRLLAKVAVRNIGGFNEKIENNQIKEGVLTAEEQGKLPYIIIIIDELADLMLTAANEVESSIVRLAQLARAVGLHLIVATQRPSANVITGLIKANMTSRIAFQVASKIDSRVIIDQNGAEKLLGRGDMLFIPPGVAEPVRLHGALISDSETEAIVEAVRHQKVRAKRLDGWGVSEEAQAAGEEESGSATDADLFIEAARLVVRHQLGSTSLIQRRLKVGYARAGRLMDELEAAGIVGLNNGSRPRDVLVDEGQLDELLHNREKQD